MIQDTLVSAPAGRAAALLAEARERTLLLVEPLSEEELRTQYNTLMGPILWDLGHIAHFEELWLLRNLEGPVEFGEMPGMFNPFEHPRRVRGQLQLPTLAGTLEVMAETRRRVLERLPFLELGSGDPLLRDGFVFRMVAQHEHQHGETMLQALQLKGGEPYRAPRGWTVPEPRWAPEGMVRFPGGEVEIGTADRSAAYDNERPRHVVALRPFLIDVTPVTCGAYLEFMEAGGYSERRWWTEAGWAWREETGAASPQFWERAGGEWTVRTMDRTVPVDPRRPVCHVSCHEAEAFARWAGKRLPTEAEWEAAATWDPDTGTRRAYPWGDEEPTREHANLDQLAFEAAPVGAYPLNVSPIGCYGMIGDVWEWTASDFGPYPGYETFPYPEYSEVFFGGEYRVLRGGSWATRPLVARSTFRNWDYPIRRQIFSGFRCAADE
ncbi:MAG TPA: ergothioneine biosynthesis protein EgtB [Longimicrobiaceae bacterium]